MATKRQREHSMIVASEKLVKRVRRDMNRVGLNKHKGWKSVFRLGPQPTKSKR